MIQKAKPFTDFAQHASRDLLLALIQLDLPAASTARETGSAVKSAMDMPFTFTANALGPQPLALARGHCVGDM